MPGRVDEVEHEPLAFGELLAGVVVKDGDGGRFDGDAALAFQVHVIEHLVVELAFGDGAGAHQQAIGKRALAVVNVGDDGEIANLHYGSSLGREFEKLGKAVDCSRGDGVGQRHGHQFVFTDITPE